MKIEPGNDEAAMPNAVAHARNDEDLDISASEPLRDGKGDRLPRRASHARKAKPKKRQKAGTQKPVKRHKKTQRNLKREKYYRNLRKELVDDEETAQDRDEERLKDLNEELKISEVDLIKLDRAMKKRPLSQKELHEANELRVSIPSLQKQIQDLENSMSKKTAPRYTRAKNAREYWARQHAAGLKDTLKRADKITGNKRKRGKNATEAQPSEKKSRGESKTVRWGDNHAGDTDEVQDSRQALAKALGIQDQQDPSLINKTVMFQQLASMKCSGPGADPRAKSQLSMLKDATSSYGFKVCKLEKETSNVALNLMRWRIKSFKSLLYNHQVVGVSWMLGREFSPHLPHGGILSDAMGLGKTVQILACMAHNPPLPEEYPAGDKYKSRATLIIVPASAISQWKNEINVHTHFDDAYIYKKSASRTVPRSMWMKADIV